LKIFKTTTEDAKTVTFDYIEVYTINT